MKIGGQIIKMTEQEQNKRINQHKRLINNLRERLKTIEADVEPDGRISETFEQIEQHLERHDKRFDRLENKVNQLGSKLDIIIEHLTSYKNVGIRFDILRLYQSNKRDREA